MKVNVKTNYPAMRKTMTNYTKLDSIEDLVTIRASVVTAGTAWINDLQVVTNGCVDLFMYNHKEAVFKYLHGDRKELNAVFDREV